MLVFVLIFDAVCLCGVFSNTPCVCSCCLCYGVSTCESVQVVCTVRQFAVSVYTVCACVCACVRARVFRVVIPAALCFFGVHLCRQSLIPHTVVTE